MASRKQQDVQTPYVRLRGLPFSSTEEDVKTFFVDIPIVRVKIVLGINGRATGEAYVEFNSKEDAAKSLEFDRKEIKGRYIEVFTATFGEGEGAFKSGGNVEPDDGTYVRLRGLPFACNETDIKTFFEGLDTVEIVIETGGPKARPTGEAFVRFEDADAAQKALEYNNKHIGSRYVEVFKSTTTEMNRAKGIPIESPYSKNGIKPLMSLDQSTALAQSYNQGNEWASYGGEPYGYGGNYGGGYSGPGGPGGGNGYYGGGNESAMFRVYMRGLPFDADSRAIEAFLSPLRVLSIKFGLNDSNRSSGDAIVEFGNLDDVMAAMARNNQRMGRRYIELFTSHDVPGNMKRLVWKDPTSSAPPALDAVLNGWTTGGRMERNGVGRRDQWGGSIVRGGPSVRGSGGRGGPQRHLSFKQEDSWGSHGYSGGDQSLEYAASSYTTAAGYNPYGSDRYREGHPVHEPAAQSWGGWAPNQNDYATGYN